MTFLLCIAIKHTGWQGSKNEWIPSNSNLEYSKHFYFSILGTKQIAIDVKIDSENDLDLERMF